MLSAAESLDPRANLWNLLAYTLRFWRKKQRLSLAQTAALLHTSRYTVSHWEAGRYKPDVEQLRVLDLSWDTGGILELIHFYARTAHDPDWFGEYARFEAKASMIKIYQCSTMPGLLQTEAYARMVMVASSAPDVEDAVQRRIARQEILNSKQPPNLAIILDERVLDTAPPDIMREQARRLLDLGDLPNVTLRLVPRTAHWYVGLEGAFHQITTNGRNVVYVDAPGGGRLVQGSEPEDFGIRWERISARALPWDNCRNSLIDLMEDSA